MIVFRKKKQIVEKYPVPKKKKKQTEKADHQ